jgi:hypothetical protein
MQPLAEPTLFARIERIRSRAAHILEGRAAGYTQEQDLGFGDAPEGRLRILRDMFSLPALGLDALVCLVAAEYDPFLRTVVRSVQGELGLRWLEIGTVAELLGLPPAGLPVLGGLLASDGLLRRSGLVIGDQDTDSVAPLVATRVRVVPRVARYLAGDDTLPERLSLGMTEAELERSLVDPDTAHAVVRRIDRAFHRSYPLIVEVTGAPGTGRRYFAAAMARMLDLELVVCDLAAVEPAALGQCLGELGLEARLRHALPCLANWDIHLPTRPYEEAGEPPRDPRPRQLPVALARFIASWPQPLLLTAQEREPVLERIAPILAHVEVRFPTPSQRAALLADAVIACGAAIAEDLDLDALARRYALDPMRIERAARTAVELMGDQAREDEPPEVGAEVLTSACNSQLAHSLSSLATRVINNHQLRDLVVSEEVYTGMMEMIAHVRYARRVYEEWGFGSRHSLAEGVSALFAGPPGTGKTMCASIMARELDMELFRVDLSRVVSKWIGETEKNLAKVFDEAQRSSALILFDEADALFAKRTEVKSSVDRYANLEVNFLLQRMEGFSGITILTTNFEDTIDTAFKRRLTFRLRFEKPDAQARAALWRKVFPTSCELAPDIDFDRLGELFEISGGNIRNAAVRAAFLAAAAAQGRGKPIDMETCILAAEREAREMGLLIRSNQLAMSAPMFTPASDTPVTAPSEVSRSAGDGDPSDRTRGRPVPITHPRRLR